MPERPSQTALAGLQRRQALAVAGSLGAAWLGGSLWCTTVHAQATAPAGTAAPAATPGAAADVPRPPELAAELPDARWRGRATMRFLGLQVYDIHLWSPQAPQPDLSGQALALELRYARKLVGRMIAERSLEEMRRIGPITDAQASTWTEAMARIFPDVQANDRLTGVHRPGQGARFFFNGQPRGEVADPLFARLFFGIWLSPRTSEPGLRQRLLAGTP